MKVLTVKQPWAHLIVAGGKDIENRTWATKYRGRLLIHAAKGDDKWAMKWLAAMGMVNPPQLVRGAIIGSVDLLDCVTYHESNWFDGPYGWVLANAKTQPPVYMRGQLGLWNFEPTNGGNL